MLDAEPAASAAEAATTQQAATATMLRRTLWVGKCISIRRRNVAAMLMQEKTEMLETVGPPSLPSHLSRAAFETDAKLQRRAALELAKAKHYPAAKNYLQLMLTRHPLSREEEEECSTAVTRSVTMSSRRVPNATYTWSNFPEHDKGCLRIAHHVLVGSGGQKPDDLKAWIRFLLVSPDLFGGPASHLIYAMAELVRAKLGDTKRFEPPGKVLAQDEKSGRWYAGTLLPPEEETAATKKSAPNDKGSGTAAAAKAVAPKEAAPAAPAASAAPKPIKDGEGAMFRVRLKATSDMPSRTVMTKQNQVLLDVETGTPKVYVPGLLLLEAAALGRQEIVMALVEQGGVSVAEADEEANTALMQAAFNCTTQKHRELCRRLLEYHCDPEMANHTGTTAWDVALLRKDPALRRIFRPSESDRDFTRAARTSFAIHSAIDEHDEDLAMKELGVPGNLEATKVHRVTPLMMAARTGSLRIAQALLDRGATPDKRSEHGCTALYVAAEEGHVHVLEALLSCGLPPERMLIPDVHETTPLMRASENGHSKAVSTLLNLTSKKQCNAVNQKGWTALLMAAYNGYAAVVKQLLTHGANAEIGKKVGQGKVMYTPLCYACMTGRLDCVLMLLSCEASLEKQSGPLALKLAVDNEHQQCAEALKSAGVTADGVAGNADDGPKDDGPKTGQKGSKEAADKARSGLAAAKAANMKVEFEEMQEREKQLLGQLRQLKLQTDSLKGRMRKQRRFGGAAHNEEMKALWAFSPSGRWSPPLMASEMERGGVITCEYGEPPQTVGFIPAADPTASALTA